MGRSVKKGPFVQPKLLERVVEMNKSGNKQVLRPGAAAPQSFPNLSATPSLFMTDASMSPCM